MLLCTPLCLDSLKLLPRWRPCLILARVVGHGARFFVVLQHGGGGVDFQPPLVAEVAEVLVVDEALAAFVEVVEHHQLLGRAHFDLEPLQTFSELRELDAVVLLQVEISEGRAESLESFLDPDPEHL